MQVQRTVGKVSIHSSNKARKETDRKKKQCGIGRGKKAQQGPEVLGGVNSPRGGRLIKEKISTFGKNQSGSKGWNVWGRGSLKKRYQLAPYSLIPQVFGGEKDIIRGGCTESTWQGGDHAEKKNGKDQAYGKKK